MQMNTSMHFHFSLSLAGMGYFLVLRNAEGFVIRSTLQ